MAVETPSDREFACFFCVKQKIKDKAGSCPDCKRPISVGSFFSGQTIDRYTLTDYVDRGYYGATFKGQNRIGKPFAIKLVPKPLYDQHGKSFDEEIKKYRRLGTHANIAELDDAGTATALIDGVKLELYFVVMEWIDGITLTRYLAQKPAGIVDLYGAVIDIGSGIARFEAENLWHNDLNSDNILLKLLSDEERRSRRSDSAYTYKIVDTGSAVFRQASATRHLDDLRFLGHHITTLRQRVIESNADLAKEDQYFLDHVGKIVARLLDENADRRIATAQELIDEIDAVYKNRFLLTQEPELRLTDPFAYLNANDFPSDVFINHLFSGAFPWVANVVAPEAQATLLTGPRGSGKTMILRSMRLKTRLHPAKIGETNLQIRDRLSKSDALAFFVSARQDIGNHCALSKLPAWTASESVIVYYFFLLYANEILDSVNYAQSSNVIELDPSLETAFCEFVCSALGFTAAHNVSTVLTYIKRKQAEVLRIGSAAGSDEPKFSTSFLSDMVDELRRLSPVFSGKSVIYLLDDFSIPKVPDVIQRVLLPFVWNAGSGYSFRVSAHSESILYEDARKNKYAVNRDFREINLGDEYIRSLEVARSKTLVESSVSDVFSRRFALSDQLKQVSLKAMLGADCKENIAAEIKRRDKQKKLRGLRYYGRNTIMKLCSGEISYLIDIIGQMARDGSKRPIPRDRQNEVIRQYARRELYRLQEYSSTGCNMYDVALNFGKLSRYKLVTDEVKVGKRSRPAEYLRIEVQMETARSEVSEVIAELLRNGVFVDGGLSSSSQGNPARRLIFRRIFTPAFPTTYNTRDTFPMTAQNFLSFARDPARHARSILSESGVAPSAQGSLLDRLIEPMA